jgi:Immunity protein family (Imm11)
MPVKNKLGASRTALKKRKFFIVHERILVRPTYNLVGGPSLISAGFAPLPEERGFCDTSRIPTFVFKGKTERDFEEYGGYWLISDRMKRFLERFDPEAFAFLKCKVQLPNGARAPFRWLCDVVRVLDALDEKKSEVEIRTTDSGNKMYSFSVGAKLIFKEDVVGSHHVFRMMHFSPTIICDGGMKTECKAAGLSGLSFIEAAKRR